MTFVASLIAYILITSVGETAEPGKCENLHHNRYVCQTFDLSSLPEGEKLSVSVQTENLQQLKHISHKANIFELEIKSSINSLALNAFKDVLGVDVLILQNNSLPVIEPDILANLKVKSLVLQNNQITEITPGAFANSKIDLLRVSDNNLKEVRKGVLNHLDLKQLDLFNNKIFSIEDGALADLSNLYTLKLEGNSLSSFDAKKIFGGAPNLQILHLQHNNLQKLDGSAFEGLQNLSTLLLGSNRITNVEPGTFNLPNLRKLDLGNNKIRKLDSSIFSGEGLKSLWELHLRNNELTSLPTSFLAQLPSLRRVYLAGNPWQCACLDLVIKWIQDQSPEGYQEAKPACMGDKDTCKEDYSLSEVELEDFKKQHADKVEVYN